MKKWTFGFLIIIMAIPGIGKIELSGNVGTGVNFFPTNMKKKFGLLHLSYSLGLNLRWKNIEAFIQTDYLHSKGEKTLTRYYGEEIPYNLTLEGYSYEAGIRYFLHWKVQPYIGVEIGKNHWTEISKRVTGGGGGIYTSGGLYIHFEPGIRFYLNNIYFNVRLNIQPHGDFVDRKWKEELVIGSVFSVGYVFTK